MLTSQVAFYTNRVGKFEKLRRDGQTNGQTKPGGDNTNAHPWHIYSHTPTHKLITVRRELRYGSFVTPTVVPLAMKTAAPGAQSLHDAAQAILTTSANRQTTIDTLENALYYAKISAYAQGLALLQSASSAGRSRELGL